MNIGTVFRKNLCFNDPSDTIVWLEPWPCQPPVHGRVLATVLSGSDSVPGISLSITCSSEETIFIVSCSAVADTHSVIFKTTCGQPVINIYIISGVKNTFLVKIVTFMCLEETAVNSRPCPVFFFTPGTGRIAGKDQAD